MKKLSIKNALTIVLCAAMSVFMLSGCNSLDDNNLLNGTQWRAVEIDDSEYGLGGGNVYTLTFEKKEATLSYKTVGILNIGISFKMSYRYEKPTVTFSNIEPVMDDESALVWALIEASEGITAEELQKELAGLTLSAIVNGDTMTICSPDMDEEFDEEESIVFHKVGSASE